MDEGAFMKKDLIETIVLPLFEMGDCVAFWISSPLDRDNPYSIMIRAKDPEDGENYFPTSIAQLACNRCERLDKPEQCIKLGHMSHVYPWWKDKNKQELILFLQSKRMSRFQNESMGLITDPTNTMVNRKIMDLFFKKPEKPINMDEKPRLLLITADPNCYGDNETAFIASTIKEGAVTIEGMAAYATKSPEDVETFFNEFLDELRNRPHIKDAIFMLIVERNSGSAQNLTTILRNRPEKLSYCVKQHEDKQYGWWTSDENKPFFADKTRQYLNADAINFRDGWVTANPPNAPKEREDELRKESKKIVYEQFKQELANYKLIFPESKSLKQNGNKIIVSGKVNSEGKLQKGQNDDLCFTFTFNIGMWFYYINDKIDTIDKEKLSTYHQRKKTPMDYRTENEFTESDYYPTNNPQPGIFDDE